MSTSQTIDALGALPLVRTQNADTADLHRRLLASWADHADERAATFDRTVGRKAAFHRQRMEELTAAGAGTPAKKVATAERAEQHWRDHAGRGEELVARLVTGLRLMPETPISQVASWAVWDEHTRGDAHWYEHRAALEALTAGTDVPDTGAIFLGLNAGEYAASETQPDAWSMFHGSTRGGIGSGRHGNIRNLADHVDGTPLAGSYMTDFYKNIPSVDEQILKALLDAAPTPDKRALNTLMALIVRDEVSVFGLEPSSMRAVALGSRVANLARTTMRDWHGILDLPHYAAYVKTETFRASADDVLAVTHPDFTR